MTTNAATHRVVVATEGSGWTWAIVEGDRIAAQGSAPDRNTAERYGAFAAAAVGAFARIGRRAY